MHKLKQWYQDLNLQSKFTLVLLLIVSIPGIAIIFFFYGRAYDMVVSYTIRQEQDRSAERAVDRRIYSESPGCKRRDFFP
ncbi:hypothetical protein [Ruminococcus sp. AM42-11]|uniref:hypothetical protein n=1 Tax=Ruminococcus sp. AM42-11 TaxID=2292372 RepID=UPI001FAA7DFA|nr:hypothetical protein [Ruminococcus sp. AM42-11]